jgi:hypothetical protein
LSGRHFHGVVDLVQSMHATSLVLEASNRFKGSMKMISLVLRGTCMKTS